MASTPLPGSVVAVLKTEHEWIVEALELLEGVTRRIHHNEWLEPEAVLGLVAFLQNFADRCHHAKEEEVLFPVLLRAGAADAGVRLASVAAEHDQARRLLRTMDQHATSVGEKEGADRFGHAAHAYAALIRKHITMENEVLFPLAEQLLGGEAANVLAAFELYEAHAVGDHAASRFRAALDDLRLRLG